MTTQDPIDPVILVSDLSHQLEEARGQIEELQKILSESQTQTVRMQGAYEAMKDLFVQMYRNPFGK